MSTNTDSETELDQKILRSNSKNPETLRKIIENSTYEPSECNEEGKDANHAKCLHLQDKSIIRARCPNSLLYILSRVLLEHPEIVDDVMRKQVSNYYKHHKIDAEGFITIEFIKSLHENKKNPSITWLKYETLLTHLIKEQAYKPKTLANELLALVKCELDKDMGAKFASAISGCVKYCQQIKSNDHVDPEEDEEKWCEIVDWISWFLSPEEDD